MNVENRKLFRNKDARARLAGMGGIIASSPELLGTVQKFQEGGDVAQSMGDMFTPVQVGNALFYVELDSGTVLTPQGSVVNDANIIESAMIQAVERAQATNMQPPQQIKVLDPLPMNTAEDSGFEGEVFRGAMGGANMMPPQLNAPVVQTGIGSLVDNESARKGSAVNTFMRNLFSPVGDAMRKKLTPVAEKIEDVVKPVGESIQTTLDPLKVAISTGRESPELRQLFSETIANQQLAMPGGSPPLPVVEKSTLSGNNFSNNPTTGYSYPTDIVTEPPVTDVGNVIKAVGQRLSEGTNSPIEENLEEIRRKESAEEFREKEKKLVELRGGLNTSNIQPVFGETTETPESDVVVSEVTKDTPRPRLRPPNLENETGNPDSFIDAALGGKTGSPKDNVKSYEAQFRELLGIKDKDKAKEMWHNLSMIGFAIAAGQDPSALANIAQGMLEGTKMMKADRDADEKLNQDIALMALGERNKDKRLEAQLENQKTIAEIRSSNASSFATADRMFKSILDSTTDALKQQVIDGVMSVEEANRTALEAASRAFPESQFAKILPDTTGPALPTLSTDLETAQKEFDALPMGARFIQINPNTGKPETREKT